MKTLIISRRNFTLTSLNCTLLSGLGIDLKFLAPLMTIEDRLPLSVQDLAKKFATDKVDLEINYLETWDVQNQYYSDAKNFLENHVFPLDVPHGKKVILGTYKHFSLNMFCKNYEQKDCIGVDIFNYQEHPQLLVKDVRELKNNELGELAIGWNNVSVWSGSPRSKLSGFNFIKNSLVPGGILIENPTRYIPQDLCFKNFQLLHQDSFGSIWRKVS